MIDDAAAAAAGAIEQRRVRAARCGGGRQLAVMMVIVVAAVVRRLGDGWLGWWRRLVGGEQRWRLRWFAAFDAIAIGQRVAEGELRLRGL